MSLTSVHKKPRRIGVIGLGTGTLASYGKQGDTIRFYEINPDVVRFANNRFYYLSDSQSQIETVVGDARLILENEKAQNFDIFVIDAFNSDAIPVHLLTYEAFTTYNRHLKDDGIICVNISNRYLNLRPVIEAAAKSFGFFSIMVKSESNLEKGSTSATWMILTRRKSLLGNIDGSTKPQANAPVLQQPWTDRRSNIFTLLK